MTKGITCCLQCDKEALNEETKVLQSIGPLSSTMTPPWISSTASRSPTSSLSSFDIGKTTDDEFAEFDIDDIFPKHL